MWSHIKTFKFILFSSELCQASQPACASAAKLHVPHSSVKLSSESRWTSAVLETVRKLTGCLYQQWQWCKALLPKARGKSNIQIGFEKLPLPLTGNSFYQAAKPQWSRSVKEQYHLVSGGGLDIITYSFSFPGKIALGHWIMLNRLVIFRDIWAKLFPLLWNTCLGNLLIHVHTVSPWTDVTFHKITRLISVVNTK